MLGRQIHSLRELILLTWVRHESLNHSSAFRFTVDAVPLGAGYGAPYSAVRRRNAPQRTQRNATHRSAPQPVYVKDTIRYDTIRGVDGALKR